MKNKKYNIDHKNNKFENSHITFMSKHSFDTADYDFRGVVENYMENSDLENLHLSDKFEKKLTSSEGDYGDQKQELHRRFYNKMDADNTFMNLYKKIVGEVVQPLFDEEVYYQEFPTFRIHQPDNICVFDWHRDMDFGHSEHEVNIFMPITKAYGNNTIWAESGEGKERFLRQWRLNTGSLLSGRELNCFMEIKITTRGKLA